MLRNALDNTLVTEYEVDSRVWVLDRVGVYCVVYVGACTWLLLLLTAVEKKTKLRDSQEQKEANTFLDDGVAIDETLSRCVSTSNHSTPSLKHQHMLPTSLMGYLVSD